MSPINENNFSLRINISPSYDLEPQVPARTESNASFKKSTALEKSCSTGPTSSCANKSRRMSAFSLKCSSVSAYLSADALAKASADSPLKQLIDSTDTSTPVVFDEKRQTIWPNNLEALDWDGDIPISEYPINYDPSPEVVHKKATQRLEYIQELAIRYLKPPTPAPPGDIIIRQEADLATPPAPPLIIRQEPAKSATPEPLVIREAPPPAPKLIGKKVITISGKRLPPPPRRVVIERLPTLPAKPQPVLIERWIPYREQKRKVVFHAPQHNPVVLTPRNTIIQWERPEVRIRKEVKYLGVVRADPDIYVQKYGASLLKANHMPEFVNQIRPPSGLTLAVDKPANAGHVLEGDLHALSLVDLDKEDLGLYKSYLSVSNVNVAKKATYQNETNVKSSSSQMVDTNKAQSSNLSFYDLITQVFTEIDEDHNGSITFRDAANAILKINSQLSRNYSENDVNLFFSALDVNKSGSVTLDEFRGAFGYVL